MEANNLMIDAESMALNDATKKEFHDFFQLFVNEVRYVLIKINRDFIFYCFFFAFIFASFCSGRGLGKFVEFGSDCTIPGLIRRMRIRP